MASIERAKTQRTGYVVRYRGPDRKPRSKTFRRKADAESFLRTVEADVLRGTWVDPHAGKILLREWGTLWWETTVNLRPSTRSRDNATYRNHIEPTFGAVPIASINHLAVRQWVAKLSASGLAPATVHKAYQVLSKILRAAVDADLLVSSPCDRVPLPRIERNEMRFLDPDGVARLANAIDPRYRALVLLGAYGGLRSGELFALRRARLDFVRARVDIVETVVEVAGHFHFGPPKTRAGRRSVPLPPFVVDELAAHVANIADDDLVFPAPGGGPIRASLFRRRTLGAGRRESRPRSAATARPSPHCGRALDRGGGVCPRGRKARRSYVEFGCARPLRPPVAAGRGACHERARRPRPRRRRERRDASCCSFRAKNAGRTALSAIRTGRRDPPHRL